MLDNTDCNNKYRIVDLSASYSGTTGTLVTYVTNAANLGDGAELFSHKSGSTLYFKTINQGAGIAIVESANTITISSTGETGSNYIFNNGLIESGGTASLGGIMLSNTEIDGNGKGLTFGINLDGQRLDYFQARANSVLLQGLDETSPFSPQDYTFLEIDPTTFWASTTVEGHLEFEVGSNYNDGLYLGATNSTAGSIAGITIKNDVQKSKIEFVAPGGMQYTTDTSSGNTSNNRWIPDKAYVDNISSSSNVTIEILTGTSRTITASDDNKLIYCVNNGVTTITLSGNSSQNIFTSFVNQGLGSITFVSAGAIYAAYSSVTVTERYGMATAIHKSSNTWTLVGLTDGNQVTYVGGNGITLSGESINWGGTLSQNVFVNGNSQSYAVELSNLYGFTVNNAINIDLSSTGSFGYSNSTSGDQFNFSDTGEFTLTTTTANLTLENLNITGLLGPVETDFVLFYDETTGAITYGNAPTGGTAGTVYSAGNGISFSATTASTSINIGGTLSKHLILQGSSGLYEINLGSTSSKLKSLEVYAKNEVYLSADATTGTINAVGGLFQAANDVTSRLTVTNHGTVDIGLATTKIGRTDGTLVITGYTGFAGAQYTTDYSANFTPRSLVDKGYVDSLVAGGISNGDKGDITVTNSGATWTIDNTAITFAKIQNVNASRLLGRYSGTSGSTQEITVGASLSLPTATGVLNLSTGDKGDITVSASGNTWTIDNSAITFAKIQNSAAAGLSVIGRSTNSAGVFAEIAAGTDGHVLRRSGTALGFGTLASGAFASNTISRAALVNGSALSVVGRSANSSGAVADIAATAASGAVLRESGSVIGWGTIATAGIANAAVTYAKIQNVNAGKILGRYSATSGSTQELTVSTGLALNSSTGNLTVTGQTSSSIFNGYTGSTAPAAYASKTIFNGYTGTTDFTRSSVTNTGSAVTLDMQSKKQKKFVFSNNVTGNTTFSFTNTSLIEVFTVDLNVTAGTSNITMPSTVRMQNYEVTNSRWNTGTRVLALATGLYNLAFSYDGSVYKLNVSDKYV